eukprot:11314_1
MNKFRIFRLLSIVAIFMAYKWQQPATPPLNPPHSALVLNEFLSEEQHKEMMTMFEELSEFPAAKQDWTSTEWVSIGEDYDPTPDGECNKRYTILNNETKKCQFPNRVDIARHYIKTGGYNGLKESYSNLIYRLYPFINYQFDAYKRKEFVDLFEQPNFVNAVQKICGPMYPHFRPFQLSMILNLPGHSVPHHLDIPYFFPATIYQFPQWLLLAMQDSDLFKQQRLPQVQALVYVHDWQLDKEIVDSSNEDDKAMEDGYRQFGGEFFSYIQGPDYKPAVVPASPRKAIFCDGSEMVHGTSIYKPEIAPIKLEKDLTNSMRFDKDNNVWRLYMDEK